MIYDSRLLDFKHTGLLQGRSQDFWQGERYQERSNRWRDFESEAARSAADQATAVVKGGGGATPFEGLGARPPESTY